MPRLLASQPISVLAFVVDNLLVPLSRLECRGVFLVLGQPYAKSDNLLHLVGALSKTARNVKLSVIWDAGGRSTPCLSPALKRCSTLAVLQDHTTYLITTGCKEPNISPTLARTSLLLC